MTIKPVPIKKSWVLIPVWVKVLPAVEEVVTSKLYISKFCISIFNEFSVGNTDSVSGFIDCKYTFDVIISYSIYVKGSAAV